MFTLDLNQRTDLIEGEDTAQPFLHLWNQETRQIYKLTQDDLCTITSMQFLD